MPITDNNIGPGQTVTSSSQRHLPTHKSQVVRLPREELTWRVMLKMFIQSMKYWRENNYDLVDRQEHKRRYAVCKECEFMPEYQCSQCGCLMFVKSKLAGQTCKDSRW